MTQLPPGLITQSSELKLKSVLSVGSDYGAGGRTRTDMRSEPRQILSLVRIPISPLRLLGHVIIEAINRYVKLAQFTDSLLHALRIASPDFDSVAF